MKITFANPGLPKTGVLVVGVLDGRKLGGSAKALDKGMSGGLVRTLHSPCSSFCVLRPFLLKLFLKA